MTEQKAEAERNAAIRRRLKYLEGVLGELTQEISEHHAVLAEQVTALSATVAKNQTIIGDKVTACQEAVQELQLMVLGEPRYMYPGLAKQVKEHGELIEEIQNERDALKNQVKGMSLGLKLAGGAGIGSLAGLIGVLVELFSK